MEEIRYLEFKIKEQTNDISKIQDHMSVCLEHKKLLDEMAEYGRANKGEPVN